MGEAEDTPGFALSDLTFRAAVKEDEPAIAARAVETYDAHAARQPRIFSRAGPKLKAYHVHRVFAQLRGPLKELPHVICATKGDHLAGYVIVSRKGKAPKAGQIALIADIWVDEVFRGRGLARELLERAREIARNAEARGLEATVWGGNEASEKLFDSSALAPIYRRYLEELTEAQPERPPNTLQRLWDQLVSLVTLLLVTAIGLFAVMGVIATFSP